VAEFELVVALEDAMAAFVATAFVLAALVATAFVLAALLALCVAAALVDATGVDDGAVATPIADEPAIAKPLVVDKFGGVIAMTAPRPPKVPPAINNPRFIYPLLLTYFSLISVSIPNYTNLRTL
jgi:hypothetical protein